MLSKKITLLLLFFISIQQIQTQCSEENPNNPDFRTAIPSSSNGAFPDQESATDITVPADTNFTLEKVAPELWLEYVTTADGSASVGNAQIVIYESDNGLPGVEIANYTDVTPTVISGPEVLFGFIEAFNVEFDIPDTVLQGQSGVETKYWISIVFTVVGGQPPANGLMMNGSWGMNNIQSVGEQAAFRNNNTNGSWEISGDNDPNDDGLDAVYTFTGTCETLSVTDFESAAFSFFLNPINNILNVKSNNQINSVTIYNLLGQKVINKKIHSSEALIDLSGIKTGAYILQFVSDEGLKSYKIIKE